MDGAPLHSLRSLQYSVYRMKEAHRTLVSLRLSFVRFPFFPASCWMFASSLCQASLAMPPRPPNFLPANRRRRLDPSRRLRSRELWNRVRYVSSSSSSSNRNNNNIVAYTKALLHAIAYECQPFPIVPTLHYVLSFDRGSSSSGDDGNNKSQTGLASRLLSSTIYAHVTSIILLIIKSTQKLNIVTFASFIITNKVTLCKTCIILIALLLYHRALLYLHDLLAIGPLVIIVTLLTVLYTVGLGDNTGANSGIPSAYSVFNKGMARLLGTIDGEELARQYAGGGAAAAADTRGDGFARLNNNNPLDDDEDEVWEEWIDEEEIVNERRRQRRLERLRRREHDDDNDNNSNNNNANEDEDYELDDTREDDQRQESAAAAAAVVATRKKSGKKARRKDLELRREMQQQRRVAAAMGFGVGDELAVEDIREIEARFALLE